MKGHIVAIIGAVWFFGSMAVTMAILLMAKFSNPPKQ